MNSSPNSHRALKVLLGTLAAALVLLGLLVTAVALLDGNQLRGPLVRYLTAHTGRPWRIDGPIEAHLVSLHPSLIAGRVTIANPPWAPAGNTAEIAKFSIVFDLPLFSQPFAIRKLVLEGANLHLWRDADAHANWIRNAPGIIPGNGLPVIHGLSIPAAHLELHDDRRHLMFDGTLSAGEQADEKSREAGAALPLRISIKGTLNDREATVTIDGDPLATASRETPYNFTLDERSSGSHLTGRGTLSHPFDFRVLDGSFEANGADLKDLHFLVGVNLPDTAAYRVSGKISRRNTIIKLTDLVATSGDSDVHGAIRSEMDETGRSRLDIDLNSKRLRLADVGAKAAGRAPENPPEEKSALLSETPFRLQAVRRFDYIVNFHAKQLDVAKLTFHSVLGKMTIDHGTITVPELSATLAPVTPNATASATPTSAASAKGPPQAQPAIQPEGKITARLAFNAKTDTPKASVDLRIANIRLGQFARKDPSQPPIDGLLQGRLDLTGRGRSLRDMAGKADGTVTLTLPQGAIRASLAELTGLDFRGLGLMLTNNKEDTPIRCGVARLQAHDGTLTSQTFVIDTDPVLITGGGTIQLDSEALDLEIQGHPKHLRVLRLSAPLSVQGTLTHPSVSLEKGQRKFKLIDPGHAKDADCGALLAEAKNGALQAEGEPVPAAERGASPK
ncbi:MAG: AsmA family rane protein [Gammaproteobacteria bacterium]|nr:AsmA family rane protein [Gammaproteobacteria bacterium]